MSVVSLQNDHIHLSVSSFGAEWQGLHAFRTMRSCLWSGVPSVWARKAPLLFPVIGRLKGSLVRWQGQDLRLTQHGFARDCEFEVIDHTASRVELILRSGCELRSDYPFQFDFRVRYELIKNAIKTTFQVTNPSRQEVLPFSVGAHPAFSYDWLTGGENWRNLEIQFERDEAPFQLLTDGLLDDKRQVPWARKLPLTDNFFGNDALILKAVKSSWVELGTVESGRKIRMEFEEPRALGLWSKKIDEFICLEPWWGIPDFMDSNQELANKEGLIWLEPQTEWQRSWKIQFIE